MVAVNFNAQNVAPNASLEPVPSGIYDARITNSVEKPTKANDGSTLIELELTISHPDPSLNNRKLFDRLNINNKKSQQAVDIAYGTLSAICHVTGRLHISDTAQLHGIPLKIVVAKVERTDQPGQFSNDVKGYKDVNGNDPGQAAPGGGMAQGQAPGGQPAWAQGGQPQGQAPQQGYAPQQGQSPQQYAPPQGQAPGQAPQPQYGQGQASNGYGNQPPVTGYDPSHQQGHGAPGHGGPGQPGGGEQHAYNQPAGQAPQQAPQGGAPAWAQGGQPAQAPQPQPQPQANGAAPGQAAPPPWAQPSQH